MQLGRKLYPHVVPMTPKTKMLLLMLLLLE